MSALDSTKRQCKTFDFNISPCATHAKTLNFNSPRVSRGMRVTCTIIEIVYQVIRMRDSSLRGRIRCRFAYAARARARGVLASIPRTRVETRRIFGSLLHPLRNLGEPPRKAFCSVNSTGYLVEPVGAWGVSSFGDRYLDTTGRGRGEREGWQRREEGRDK